MGQFSRSPPPHLSCSSGPPPSLGSAWDSLPLSLPTLFPAIRASELRCLRFCFRGNGRKLPTTSDMIPLKRVGYRTTHHVLEQTGFSIKNWTINPSISVFSQGVGGVGALIGMRLRVVLRVECTLSHPVLGSASPPPGGPSGDWSAQEETRTEKQSPVTCQGLKHL